MRPRSGNFEGCKPAWGTERWGESSFSYCAAGRRSAAASLISDSTDCAVAGASTLSFAFLPAAVTSTAGARSHNPRHWLRSHVALRHACDVIANMGDDGKSWLKREHSIKRGHAVNLGRRNVQAQGDIVEGAR